MVGFEKEITSLLRKMEARKGCGVRISRGKRKMFSASHVEREIRNLECLVNYNSSPLSVREKGRSCGVQSLLL